jgi:Ser/Thr protein kinase RdoA (MazF antagonist)
MEIGNVFAGKENKRMVTIAIPDKYAETLRALGDMPAAIDLALQRYAIEQITGKLAELRQREAGYVAKYGLDYPIFAQRAASDENLVHQIETQVSKVWEVDLADWEFCYKGIQDWTQRLQTLLLG